MIVSGLGLCVFAPGGWILFYWSLVFLIKIILFIRCWFPSALWVFASKSESRNEKLYEIWHQCFVILFNWTFWCKDSDIELSSYCSAGTIKKPCLDFSPLCSFLSRHSRKGLVFNIGSLKVALILSILTFYAPTLPLGKWSWAERSTPRLWDKKKLPSL